MSTETTSRFRYTFDDFLALVGDDRKADLLNGVIYMASPESLEHNRLEGWLYRVVSRFVELRDLGEVFFGKVAFRLTEHYAPEPDLGFVAKGSGATLERGCVNGPPDLAVEIVSPDSVRRDYVDKRIAYEEAGVKEYWIIDPMRQETTFLVLSAETYQDQLPEKGEFHSKVLAGFSIEVAWLFSENRPSPDQVLQRMRKKSKPKGKNNGRRRN